METLEKKAYLNALYGFYRLLLTEKQQKFFEYYYYDDYSLQEIAELEDVSRNAVFDHLKKVEDHLEKYEASLHLYELKEKRRALLEMFSKTKETSYIEALGKLDE